MASGSDLPAPRAAARSRSRSVLAPAALAAAGAALPLVLAEQVLRPRRNPRLDHRVLAVAGTRVALVADHETTRPGRYGVHWPGGHAVLGPLIAGPAPFAPARRPLVLRGWSARRQVVRVLERVDSGELRPGKVGFGHVATGDPQSACGLDYEEVLASSELGGMPCFLVPPAREAARPDTWAVLVHGYGGSRASSLDYLPMVHRLGTTALAIAYRNDAGAPPSPDGRYHLGATEWRDLDAAMALAVARGARRLVLMGWSMGGAIVMQAYDRSAHRPLVAGIVLDCPVLDWRAVLTSGARRHHVPRPLSALAARVVEHRIGTSFDELDWTKAGRAASIEVPALVFHGEEDDVVPVATSRAVVGAGRGRVELEVTPQAGHVGSWNVDPDRYEQLLAGFFARLDAGAG